MPTKGYSDTETQQWDNYYSQKEKESSDEKIKYDDYDANWE